MAPRNNRRKPAQPDMNRDCWVNYGSEKAKYFATYTEAVQFCESIDTLNLQPVIIYDAASMRNITAKLITP